MSATNQSLAVVFPGQGSQFVGMLGAFSDQATVRNTFAEASDALGYDVWALAQNGPADKLNQTEFTQPVLLTADVALWRLLRQGMRCMPAIMAGHSLGEYAALVAAGSLELVDGVKLVQQRAQAMQAAVPLGEGAAAAVLGLDDETIGSVCAAHSRDGMLVVPTNFNAPGQTVIAGHKVAVDAVSKPLAEAGAKRVLPLNLSIPSHCELMRPAATVYSRSLSATAFTVPSTTIIHNADLQAHADENALRQALEQQLYLPVRWVATIACFAERNIRCIIECGPGKVLTNLGKRVNREIQHLATDSPEILQQTLAALDGAEIE